MRLTVVVPIYNVKNYIFKCVESIKNQTFSSIEIILVDDGSTDGSGEIADFLSSKYENVIVIHQENQGLSGARNTGINACHTELITFVDSDDYLELDMYENLIRRMDIYNADISIGGVFREDIGSKKIVSMYPPDVEMVLSREEALVELNSLKYFNMSVCNVVFKTNLFNTSKYDNDNVRFPLGKKSEDEFIAHKIYARANKIVYTSKPYYHYIQRPGSITLSKNINVDQLMAAKDRVDFYIKWFPELVFSANAEYVFTSIALLNTFIRRGVECPVELEKKLRNITKTNLNSVINNNNISLIKKIQVLIFVYLYNIYKLIIKYS